MVKRQSSKVLSTHIFFFLLFLVVPVLVAMRPPGEPFLTITRPFVEDIIANALYLVFFYVNYYVLIPKFYFQHKYIQYSGCVLLCLALILVLPYLLTDQLRIVVQEFPQQDMPNFTHDPHLPHNRSVLFFAVNELRRHLYFFFTAIFFSFLLRTREHLNEIKEEKFEAEIASLKSQINPHFLFNTLNSIYILSLKKDDRASDAIINLAGIMRYAIKDARGAKILLQKEVEYIENYIELQKSRFGNTADIIFEYSGEPRNLEISPLLLITYIENAFKYGVNPDMSDCVVEIILQITNGGITLRTFNKKVQLSAQAEATGIGLDNTKDRLAHLYPQKHNLKIIEDKLTYSVTLSIELV